MNDFAFKNKGFLEFSAKDISKPHRYIQSRHM